MRNSKDPEYDRLKEFMSFFFERYANFDWLAPNERPLAVLEALERKSIRTATKGLRMAINDAVESLSELGNADVEKLDAELRSRGIVTLSELRRSYSKDYTKIVKQGKIKNESQYYLIQNVLNDRSEKSPEEREMLEKMIADYEGS